MATNSDPDCSILLITCSNKQHMCQYINQDCFETDRLVRVTIDGHTSFDAQSKFLLFNSSETSSLKP